MFDYYNYIHYSYDAWGKCTILKNTNNIANTNPLRYRGYYYDTDTELYYLQSRYYDANTGRFINADDSNMLLDQQDSIVQYNLFAYCGNNNQIFIDESGKGFFSWLKSFFGIKKKADKFKSLYKIMTSCKNVSELRLEHIKNIFNIGSGKYNKLSKKLKYKDKNKYIKYIKNRYKAYVENHIKYLNYPVKYSDVKKKAWGKISKKNRNKIINDAYMVDPNFFNRSGVVAASKATIEVIGLVYSK